MLDATAPKSLPPRATVRESCWEHGRRYLGALRVLGSAPGDLCNIGGVEEASR
jgi:hypothetical protein